MLDKLNSCSSYKEIGLQNRSWACIVAASKRMINATIDNNDGVQETLTGKGATHDTNMTLFQPICESLFLSLFENLTILSGFNVFEMSVKRTVCSTDSVAFFQQDIRCTNLLDFIIFLYNGRNKISSYFSNDSVCSLCVSL